MKKRRNAFLFFLAGMALFSLCGAVMFQDFMHIKRNGVEMLQPGYPYGQISVGQINGHCFVDGITSYKTLASATNDPECSSIEVAPLYAESFTADWTIARSNVAITFGACNITNNGFRTVIPSGVNNVVIFSPFSHSSNLAGSNLGCSFGNYTGSGGVFTVGDSSGFIPNVKISGINVGLFNAAAGATGFLLTNVVQADLNDDQCVEGPVSGQACVRTVGTGALFAGLTRIMGLEVSSSASATNNFGIQLSAISNAVQIFGGHFNLGGNANNSVCIDVGTNSSGVYLGMPDCDVAQIALTVESTASTGAWGFMRIDSGTANAANFGAGSQGNVLYTNGNLSFVDNGVSGTNSVINPARFNWRTDVWQIQAAATSFLLNDFADSSRLVFTHGAGGQTRLNAGSGAGQTFINFDTGSAGLQMCKGTQSTASCTLWNPTTTAQRTLTSPDGNSSTVIPFSFTTTAATTDNVTVTGMTSSGHCSLDATNSAAAAGLSSVFISAKTTNQITVTHTATAGWTFDGLCTSN